MDNDLGGKVVCVAGLGYVGLPLVQAFARSLKVIAFDVDSKRVAQLNRVQTAEQSRIRYTDSPEEIGEADFIMICVPTPVTRSKEPDLSYVKNAARTISKKMKRGCVVILESTVFPGVTEDVVKPILEESGMICGRDFKIAYSPERINPGDEEHALEKTTKVVAGMDTETTELLAQLYGMVTPYIFKAVDIKTAEAAKVIENIQRDLNIALINELSMIFRKMGINTRDVLEAAGTKWNFHQYTPGLVGGHCIPVDPYYLVYKAEELGHRPQVILAGRLINDHMPKYVIEMIMEALNSVGKVITGSKVLIMGLTYKANVADIRETPAKEIIRELKEYGVEIFGYDPLLDDIETEFGVKTVSSLDDISNIDCVILAVAHEAFKGIKLDNLKGLMNGTPVLVDLQGIFARKEAEEKGFYYVTL